MNTVLIVEDNEFVSKNLEKIVLEIDCNLNVLRTSYAAKALEYGKNQAIDLFLLDIQLLDYSGIELGEEIRAIKNHQFTPIIFITAIPTKELIAFHEIHCYDYIIKPFKVDTVKKILKPIIDDYSLQPEKNKTIKIKQKGFSILLKCEEIIYIEYFRRKLVINTVDEIINVSNRTLKDMKKELPDYFKQCHRSYLLNINYIKKINKTSQNIELIGKCDEIPIGNVYKNELYD
jgi:two-component system LytT family response regulator